MSHLVLVADGDQRSTRYVVRCLHDSGYAVVCVRDVEHLLREEAQEQPAVILLDKDLAGSVLEAVRRLREVSEVPIILLSLVDDGVASAGLRCGADAVLMKPFSAELLVAHIGSLVRRMQLQHPELKADAYRCGTLSIDFSARVVTVDGQRTHLSRREYRLLQVLATNGGRVLTHDQLLRLVWGPGYEESSDLVRGYVRNLRRKIGDDARHPLFIYTEGQVGYWMQRSEAA